MRNVWVVGILVVAAMGLMAAPAAAQSSCTGNGCRVTMGVTATVVGTYIPSAARVTVQNVPNSSAVHVVTSANTRWTLSVERGGSDAEPAVSWSGRPGGVSTDVRATRPGLVVTTLVAA